MKDLKFVHSYAYERERKPLEYSAASCRNIKQRVDVARTVFIIE